MATLIHGTEPRNVRIEVIGVNLLAGTGPLRAFASVRLGDVIIHDCRVVQQAGQRAWVSLPQREYLHDGQKKYTAIVELSESLKREVSRFVLAAWERRASDAR
jgi:DNA-binding cell septation regulator SpoVG